MMPVEAEPPFRRGLSLGWRLALASSIVATLAMAMVMVVQRHAQTLWESEVAEHALSESIRPLAARIERASSLEEAKKELSSFHKAYSLQTGTSHFVALSDATGNHLYGSPPTTDAKNGARLFMASLAVDSPLIPGHHGTLFVWDLGDHFTKTLAHQRWLWWVHFLVTMAALILTIQVTIHLLLTKPLSKLLDRVRLMQMGYWGAMAPPGGAWEIRWLAWRFQRVGEQLLANAKHLVEAERRADQLVSSSESCPTKSPLGMTTPANKIPHDDMDVAKTLGRLADQCSRLAQMNPKDSRAKTLAKKAWEGDAIEAERLGSHPLRCELEDVALGILEPAAYPAFKRHLITREKEILTLMNGRTRKIANLLKERGIPVLAMDFRMKHPASAWRKTTSLGIPVEELHDLYGLRIIVPTIPDCYWALGVIHDFYEPQVCKFKDYVAAPKENGYQSLHTTVRGEDGPVFEVQIRTGAMHQHAEQGSAAHWTYQQNHSRRPHRAPAWIARLLDGWTG